MPVAPVVAVIQPEGRTMLVMAIRINTLSSNPTARANAGDSAPCFLVRPRPARHSSTLEFNQRDATLKKIVLLAIVLIAAWFFYGNKPPTTGQLTVRNLST